MFMSDGFALVFKMMFIVAGILTALVSHDFLRARGVLGGEFHALLLFAIVGMMLLASAYDFMTLFVGIELTSLSTYILVGLTKKDLWSNEAAIKYFLLSIMASAVLLFGISIVYAAVGTTNFGEIYGRMGELAGRAPGVPIAALVFLAVGFGFKITAVPFHMYAPDVYQGAPTPVTIFLSVGPKAAAFAGLARTLEAVAHPIAADWLTLMSVLAVLTMTVGNVAAIAQQSVKRMLAYSSVAHSGYVLIGVAAMAAADGADSGAPGAAASVVFYLFAYTFMNAGAFSLLLYMRRGDDFGEDLRDFSGLARRRPAVAVAMLVLLLSLAGIPPTAGFFGKFYIFMAAINAKMYLVAAAGVVNVVISLFYYARIVVHMYMREPEAEVSDVGSAPLHAALFFSVTATIVLGVFPQTALVAIERATAVIVTGGVAP
jgi:NADH-quinone oxidoreductase subunit N